MPDLPVLAGTVSTVLFVTSYLPMLVKAWGTRDLASYSRGNLVLASVGNAVYSLYVLSLPFGPIWFLHGFYVASTAVMLLWHVRHVRPSQATVPDPARSSFACRLRLLPAPPSHHAVTRPTLAGHLGRHPAPGCPPQRRYA